MNNKQEAILVHKIEVVCNLMELYIKQQQKPKIEGAQPEPVKPSRYYDPELNRIDMPLILRTLARAEREEKEQKLKPQLERIAALQEELARWQRIIALQPPQAERFGFAPPPPELIKKMEAYIARAEAFIKQHQGDLPTIAEFRAIDDAVRKTEQNKESGTK